MKVINQVIYFENPYHRALYSGLEGRYEPIRGDVDAAIQALRLEKKQILHIHWEEHTIRYCQTAAEARASKDYLLKRLQYFRKMGGRAIWTVHNHLPHELEHPDVFLALRQELANEVDLILVHNLETVSVLHTQVTFDTTKLFYLPHPSYLGIYEPEDQAELRALARPHTRRLLAFGKMRRYKGFDALLDNLPEDFLEEHQLTLSIVGQPLPTETYVDELLAKVKGRDQVSIDPRNVPDEEVAPLFRAAECLILPYERFLTSGVALLALTLGLPVIAPATNGMRELFPGIAHRLLYKPGDVADFRRAVLDAVSCTDEERAAITSGYLDRARYLHPARASRLLGELYDRALGIAPSGN